MNTIEMMNRRQFVSLGALAGGLALFPSLARAKDGPSAAELPKLAYDFNALEPHIDARTMEIHYGKHHAGYVSKLNAALDQQPELKALTMEALMARISMIEDRTLQSAVRNNGGGHWNHTLFWNSMAPAGMGGKISDKLGAALQQSFGSVDDFKSAFAMAAATRFGSGWAWLIVQDGKLKVTSTANQDNPLMHGVVADVGTPVLGLDVWEHAYYLHYQNRRTDYISAWWNVVDWAAVSKRFEEADA